MASVRQISRRIRSVQNTAKITKAMSMIAASKLRRSQDAATQGRSYSDHMEKMVSSVMGQIGDELNNQPLASNREINNVGLLIITPDRGLTGGLNSNLIRAAGDFIAKQNVPVKVITVGKKGTDYSKRSSLELISDFSGIGDRPSPSDTVGIARELMKSFESRIVDAFYVAYAQFISTTLQKPSVTKLLPISETAESDSNSEYIYEPSPNDVLSKLLPRYIETLVHHAVLEANASEQSARMVAMNQATDNANAMVDDLTLLMNKMRQEMITNELLDIVGGVSALEG